MCSSEGRSTPDEKLRPPVHNNTSNSEQAQTVKGGGVGGSSAQTYYAHTLPPSARLCTAAVRCPRNRDAQRHQYVGAWEGVAPVCRCRCVRRTAARKGKEGKGGFPPEGVLVVVPRRTSK